MLSILSVFGLFIATSNAYILLYPIQAPIYTMPVSSKTVQAPSVPVNRIGPAIAPVVVNFADYDCSGGDGTYPDFESGCETYYVCSGDRVCIFLILIMYHFWRGLFIGLPLGRRGEHMKLLLIISSYTVTDKVSLRGAVSYGHLSLTLRSNGNQM